MRSQVAAEAASIKQGSRNAKHTLNMLQDAADNLEAINDALEEMETLVDQAAAGALWPTEESVAQARMDELLTEIDTHANKTTYGASNVLTSGPGTIAVSLGHGSAVTAQTIQVSTFDVTTQGLNLGASLELKGADTASRIDAAMVAVDTARGSVGAVLARMGATIQSVDNASAVMTDAGEPVTDTVDAQELAETVRRQLTGSVGVGMTFKTDVLSKAALDLLGVPSATPRSETVLPWHTSSLV